MLMAVGGGGHPAALPLAQRAETAFQVARCERNPRGLPRKVALALM